MRIVSVVLGLLVAGFVSAAMAQATRMPPDPKAGHAIALRWCQTCHIVEENQAHAVDSAPSFIDLARDSSLTPDVLRAFLHAPKHPMPPLDLSSSQIEDLIAYIDTLKAAK